MANDTPRESYPSPGPASNSGLPFYQSSQRPDDHVQDNDEQDGPDERTPSSPEADGEAHHEVPDDPQLRANLANMMGSFGNFGALTASLGNHMGSSSSSQMPHGSVAYAEGSGLGDAGSPFSTDRNKDKRNKVTRACDECRRKKIRCDSIDETGSMPCTNCTRTGAKCAFRRQPLKRGPSKGYIKELAERLNFLEQQVQPPHLQQQHRYEIQQLQQAMAEGMQTNTMDGRPMQDPRIGDKRSFDMADGLQGGQVQRVRSMQSLPSVQSAQSLHSMQSDGMRVSQDSASFPRQRFQNTAGGVQPFWRFGNDHRQEPVGLAYGSEIPSTITDFDWDESVIDEYYRIIHQTFPLLPNNKSRLRQRLAECPASLREAFLVALDCLMRTFPTTVLSPNPGYAQALQRAAELLAKYPFDNPSSHTDATNLVYLQTLLLMALESDNHGPATMRGQAGPSRAELLGRAAGVAGQLEMNIIRPNSQSVMQGDRDSDDRLARRVWWVLFILDRWHASSTADLLKLPENSVVLLPEDQMLLGESTYHLARLSFIIGHMAAIVTTIKTPLTDVMSPANPASALLGLTLAGEIDRFRESVESVWGSLNLVHLSYHHCHLLIKRLNPTTEPTDLIQHAVKVATVLNSRLTPVTPLNHHFGALAAMTLCELCDVPKTRAEAIRGLDQMIECLGQKRGLAGKLESTGWDGAVRELVVRKKERLQQQGDGLHDLADAAAASDNVEYDPTQVPRHGYLTCLAQGMYINS